MLGDFIANLLYGVLAVCPVLALPVGFVKGLGFLVEVIGYINVFIPVIRLAPIIGVIVMVRNWSIFVSMLRFVMRFIPFIG